MGLQDELQATCNGLGYHEGSQYIKEPDCIESVKELIRFLRREDDTCDIRRFLGHAQILQRDLLPLIKQHHRDKILFDTIIRLLVNLTQPVIVCFNNHLPEEKTQRQYCLEIESHLQQYKEAFADEELFTVLAKKMGALLELDWEHRHEEDKLMLERLLILVRNVLHIPPDPAAEQRTDDDASLHDQILWAIHVSGMEDLLLYVTSSEDERQFCMHILEIISLMFREQSPEVLALAGVQRSMTEKEKDQRKLEMARLKERTQRRNNLLKFSTRHSHFGGTYIMVNNKSLSDKDLIYHKPIQEADNFTLDTNKKRRKVPRNRQAITDVPVVRRSTLSIRLGLKEFCVQLLENAYNPLMYAVKDNLVRETTQDLDETYYLWAMRFFMEFCRHHSGYVDFISETMSVPTFHYIYNNLLRYYEMIMVEKKEAVVWGRRVHLALRAYQELLLTLDMMDHSKNRHLQDSARVIKSNVFYVMEFRDIFVTLLKRFDQTKNSRAYLKDLVETTNLFLRMLEKYTKGSSHLVVQGKRKKGKKKTKKSGTRKPEELSETQLEDMWGEISSDLSAMLQGREEIPEGIAPFDAASEVDVEQQRVDAMVRIHTALRNRQPGEAVAIFRAAREVWPERNEFGSQDITAEEEFMALREIFMAPMPGGPTQEEEQPEEEGDEAEEDEVAAVHKFEEEFNFTAYLNHYGKPEILKNYVLLAADFEKNSTHTNHCVAKMLHRIGFDLGYIGMLFQASLFRVFQQIMLGPHAKSPRFQELYKFAVHVVRKFSEVAQKNKKVFMEILFWKSSKEAMQTTEGYNYQAGGGKVAWTEQDENELMRLFEDFRDSTDTEKDAADLILERWTGEPKSRSQILRQLKNLHLIESAKDLKKKKVDTRAWTTEDEEELERLHNEFRDSSDPLGNIVNAMSKKRSKQNVVEKLLELGLVHDRKELRKKRCKKGREPRRSRRLGGGDISEGEEGGLSDIEDGGNLPTDEDSLSSGASDGDSSSDSGDNDADRGDEDKDGDAGISSCDMGDNAAGVTGLSDLLQSVVEKGYLDQVTWIQRLLNNCANNREIATNIVSVPVVPLTEDNETAMEDPIFVELLQGLGLSPPSNEQEIFWRIPADLTAASLKNLSQALNLDDDGKPVNPEILAQIRRASASKRGSKKKKDKSKKKTDKKKKDKNKMKKKRKHGLAREENPREGRREIPTNSDSDDDADILIGRRTDKTKSRSERQCSLSEQEGVGESGANMTSGSDAGSDKDNGEDENDKEMNVDRNKQPITAQRREALKAMLERRKSKKTVNRDRNRRTRENTAGNDTGMQEDENSGMEQDEPASTTSLKSATPASSPNTPAPQRKSKKRVKRIVMDSDSDRDTDDDRLVIDHGDSDAGSRTGEQSPRKPASKRARLLDSDLSDEDKENKETSFLTSMSDDENEKDTGASQSQSQSQPPLDFGDSSDEDMSSDKTGDNAGDDSDDDVPLTEVAKTKVPPPESFPATLFSQGRPGSDDSDLDDHVPLGKIVKKSQKIMSDDEDD